MDHNMPGMGGGGSMAAPPPMTNNNAPMGGMMHGHKMMMHMTFFWGSDAEILFPGWPGTSPGYYALALVFVFALSLAVEWLNHCQVIREGSTHVAAGLIQTLLHGLRVGLSLMVMLAVMSFNAGVFLVAVAGHTLGFLLFGSRVFRKSVPPAKTSDLPPMSC